MRLRWPIVLIALALIVGACASPSGSPAESAPAEESAEPEESASAEESAEPSEAAAESEAPPAVGEMVSVFELEVGLCFDDPAESAQVFEVMSLDCGVAHDNEVYYLFDHDGSTFPGDAAMAASADDGCEGAFEAYVGIPYLESALYYTYLIPTQESWDDGDREIVCVIYEPGEKLTGSMEGAAR
ncbi:MAG TPA: septum formation family protein [Candidatus Limnocylindria bacterium]